MVLLEALYLGIPVVARRVGGIPDVIQDGVSGVLVDSSDPQALASRCVNLLRDSGLRARLALGAAARVTESFTADHNAAQVAALYKFLCGLR
jgi:glycosyltransferase involved in cell wall biosynthesis